MRANGSWQRSATGLMSAGLALAIAIGTTLTAQDSSGADPADANMAPVNGAQVLNTNQQAQPTQPDDDYGQQSPAPVVRQAPTGDQAAASGDSSYDTDVDKGETALEADQAPPPLPDYDQPAAPDPDDLWTPGYWSWGPGGYYWVPGVWVAAPYPGALWTPGYWGYYGGRYRFYHGYWGMHVGYYGGINYGFGYIGTGYYGGYWDGPHFYYNTAVSHVNGNIRYTYQHAAPPPMYSRGRVSFNGGSGGISARPSPAEVSAMHEQHAPAMAAQVQNRQQASQNREQFLSQNHGRPTMTVAGGALPADRRAAAPARVAQPAARPEGRGNPMGKKAAINKPMPKKAVEKK